MERPFWADEFRSSAFPRLQRVAGFCSSLTCPCSWVYLQTLNFVFWNVLAVVCSDDYCTHDAVDALRRLGVPHNRQSLAYRIACGWWPRDFWNRCLYVTLAWTCLFGGLPLIAFLITPPYHKEQASKTAFVLFVTLWSSGVGAALSTLVCVRAAGEGTSSPFYVRCEPSSARAAGRSRARAAPTRGSVSSQPSTSWRGDGAGWSTRSRRSRARCATKGAGGRRMPRLACSRAQNLE